MALKRFLRTLGLTSNALAAFCLLASVGCSSSNSSPTTETGGTTTGSGGSNSAAGTGGAKAGGTGGTTAATGGSSAAGTSAAGGAAGGTASGDACPAKTAGGVDFADKVVCAASDPQTCSKTCGVESKAVKTLTCTNGAYDEGTCTYPTSGDYSCYKVPSPISTTCPTTVPKSGQECTIDKCVVCNLDGNYKDSKDTSKPGYCVCQEAGTSGTRKWSCASTAAWPCPGNSGC